MHSIPIDEDPLPETLGGPIGPGGKPSEVEVLGDLRGHVLAGRYVLTELLGSGDLGCVYSGRDQASNQQVVVKVLAAPEQREVVARIAERARRRLGVRQSCVAAVLAEGTMGGLWYAVMEHAEGKNLYHADGDPRFEGAGLLKLAAELAEGLATLHALGAPHGAISPGNLVWSQAGVKLVDLDVQAPSHLSGGAEPVASTDVSMLASVLLEVAGVREDEAPWIAPIARVVRGEARPSAAEWAQQLRNAEIDALKPGVADAAKHAEGAIDSAWDQVFESADLPYRPSAKGKVTIDTGLHRIEPPPQLAVLSYEVEVEPEPPPEAQDDEPSPEGLSATSLTSLTALVEELEPEVAATPLKPSRPEAKAASKHEKAEAKPASKQDKAETRAASKPDSRPAKAASRPATKPPMRPPTAPPMAASPLSPVAAASESMPAAATSEPRSFPVASQLLTSGSAQPEAPADDDDVVIVETAGEAIDDVAPGNGGADQLSAGDFRKVLLRTNRSPRVRQCYDEHGPGDVEVVALVGRGGKVLKLRMAPGPLSDCLRKVVLKLEFPRAARQAQHNYVFHPPNQAE
ncbi:hypothetical protein OV090_34300 [Nannocystis sp. RBIL2]|uniref:protein kinase domain-containing protein n=1 Tax=Nannocystis sp. RBIL2 TaxID=2996788 RepID=UPI0022716ECE|nr:protein kinase [Nannocystis sp. RBIL2]MCY1069864.1 hypothetical protein [Nannocystis sp. RBIL2]